jgi:translation elongation factor EF-G
VTLDGDTHAVNSSQAFQSAAMEAVTTALAQAGTTPLEPVMAVTIDTPATHLGDVVGDVQRRHGRVAAIEDKGVRATSLLMRRWLRLRVTPLLCGHLRRAGAGECGFPWLSPSPAQLAVEIAPPRAEPRVVLNRILCSDFPWKLTTQSCS